MPSGTVEIENKKKDIKFKGYVTAPATGVYPGVLLLHQDFGIDANIRSYAESLAANNYTVFVPDLFWRDLPGCELNSTTPQDIEKSKTILKDFNIDNSFDDITLCLKWLRETPQCNGLVSVIGFGVGANLAYLAGLWLDIESTVCYDFHGFKFFKDNDTFIRRPMLVHLSGPVFSSLEKSNKNNLLENEEKINIFKYENCLNNFYRIADKNYNYQGSLDSFNKTLEHIKKSFDKPHTT